MKRVVPSKLTSFPRVSGDEPLEILSAITTGSFSPRERG